ncbi:MULTISPECIES: hypothetical protein [Enterobacteriaceae]|uniref:hypothetical protein n=1 Tax=Enterobacteriaceae TaxID=543 RepID=UPI00041411E5|nr:MULTISPECIES: hypothetical protein [Enterobacteriaceae]EDQ0257677.1 hypothetical protein [Salmonella enterica subsp. enterica serovar Soerenga]EGZ3899835.1 hypothetical protein [Salmonella enterica subsp. enterica serovar Pisa]EDQ8744206.1 hypothetical protein [Salmonella enterica subsp. enterica serovar Soerenga]EDR0674816.1 hypothetical protein [Salmonella enterica subsp. enterica serovar Soerenga]EDR2011350.1 hypothetical protein [Salmonella enterica subsp. enterica serovar Soerenga]
MSALVTEHPELHRLSVAAVALVVQEQIRELTARRVPGTALVVVLVAGNMVPHQ